MGFLGLVLALLPGFAWLIFYLQEDPHPEPKRLIFFTFVCGAASAVVALYVQRFARGILDAQDIALTSIAALVLFALIEELAKFGAAYFPIRHNPAFDEPVDAMIYMVVAALGFATLENYGALNSNAAYLHLGETALVSKIFEVASLRFVGATLLHTLTSGIMGYHWALSIRNFGAKRYLISGIVIATLLHAVFNYLILSYGELIYSLVFVVIVGFFALSDFEKLKESPV